MHALLSSNLVGKSKRKKLQNAMDGGWLTKKKRAKKTPWVLLMSHEWQKESSK